MAAPPPPVPLAGEAQPVPAWIGRYRILRLLGEGGMGAVYEAEQESPQRTVALKVIRAGYGSSEILRRFENETQALGRLQHPGIAQIYEAGAVETPFGKQPYIAMELVHGKTLLDYCGSQKLSTRERLDLMATICDAVQHAHQRGLIHRDLKPANVMVGDDGLPKILDFGIARLTDSDAQATRQTSMGEIIGTLAYMSPEQISGDLDEVDTRSDVYALGVILFELLAGKPPYEIGRQIHEAVRTIREKEPTALSSFSRMLRGDVETIVGKALEKDKTRRYGSAAELGADIRRHLRDEPIAARPPSTAYQMQKFARRNKVLVGGSGAVFVVLVLGVVASTWEAVQARRSQTKAQQETAIAQAVNDFLQNDLLGQASAYNQSKPDPNITVRTVLDRAAQKIEGRFGTQPEVETAIRDTIGNTYEHLGLYLEARNQLEAALALSRRTERFENPMTLNIMADLGAVAEDQGKYAEAEKLLGAAVEADRRVLGRENAQTLRAMNRLGIVYSDEGKYKHAESLLLATVEIRRRVLGSDRLETAAAMQNLASTYENEGKYPQATTLEKEALDIFRRAAGPENPRTLSAMNALAVYYRDASAYAQAEALEKEALAADQRVLGPDHLYTLAAMTNLALVYDGEGRLAQAEVLYTQALSLDRKALGLESPATLLTMANLADLYDHEGKYAQEAALCRQVLDLRRRLLGPENPQTLASMNNAANAYEDMGNYRQARTLFLQTAEIDRRVLGPENTYTLIALANIGKVDTDLGFYSQAESEETSVLATMRRVLGAHQGYTLMVGHMLASADAADGKYTQADPLYHQTLDAERQVLGAENQETLQTLSGLGTMYQQEKKYREAESCAMKAVAGMRHVLGPQNSLTANVEADLALAVLSEGKFAQAEPLARDALSVDSKTQPDNWQRFRAESLLGESLAGQKKFVQAAPPLHAGYDGMLARKAAIDAPDLYHLQRAQLWLAQLAEARVGAVQAAAPKPQ